MDTKYIFYCKKCNYLTSGYEKDLISFWSHKTSGTDNRCLNEKEYNFKHSSSLGIVFVVMDKS